ncbi:MAG TPA: hypothetical protein VHP36_10525 [Chitinispirillaceae bacterium]|nr:hypothetical protein [Chitinispirillaceae bacterium]
MACFYFLEVQIVLLGVLATFYFFISSVSIKQHHFSQALNMIFIGAFDRYTILKAIKAIYKLKLSE